MSRAAKKPVFTASNLRDILDRVFKRGVRPSQAQLQWLAFQLNFVCATWQAAQASPAKQARFVRVRYAIAVLEEFFKERKRLCRSKNGKGRPSARVVAAEQQWSEQFASFWRATEAHDKFLKKTPEHELLEMDVDEAGMVNQLDSWRHIAEFVAVFFRAAMQRNNPDLQFGRSNDGPVPRFVAAAVPLITAEKPTVLNVGKHLKDLARKRLQASHKQGQPKSKLSRDKRGTVCPRIEL